MQLLYPLHRQRSHRRRPSHRRQQQPRKSSRPSRTSSIRCAEIVAARIKGGRVKQACVFAFDTNLSGKEAIAALSAAALDPAASVPDNRRIRMGRDAIAAVQAIAWPSS